MKNLFGDVEADVWVVYVKIDGTFYLISTDSAKVALATANLSANMCGSVDVHVANERRSGMRWQGVVVWN